MTPLKALILVTLRKDGPLSDLELWTRTGERSATEVVLAALALNHDGYIEPPHHDPHIWQLSTKGSEYVAAHLRSQLKEVPIGTD